MDNIRCPKLSKVPSSEIEKKPDTPKALRKLLQPKDKLDLDDISLSGSEISDAFEEIGKSVFLSFANIEKPKKKHEADEVIMSQFTEDFKETMKATRKELKLGKNLMTENVADIHKILNETREPQELPESVQQRIDELLKDTDYMCSTPSQKSDEGPSTRKASSIGFDAMSGVWRMLAVEDAKEKFKTSSPSFNAFEQEEPHWLETPTVSWKTLDFSKHKCENWLNEQQD